jgi:hypothetical protein
LAVAETFRCKLTHVVIVKDNGDFEDDKETTKDTEFFLAIDNQTQRGTSSFCTKTGCANTSEIAVIERDGKGDDIFRRITLLYGRGVELWTLEGFKNSDEYTAAAASVSGLRSQTRFGRCRIILQ